VVRTALFVGHVTPEAQEGGPIALVRDGETVTIDAEKNRIDVAISDADLARRRAEWESSPLQIHAWNTLQIHQEREVGVRGVA